MAKGKNGNLGETDRTDPPGGEGHQGGSDCDCKKSMEKKEEAQEAHQEKERASRAAADERLTAGVPSAVEMMVKQITKLENIVYRKEDEIRDNVKAEHRKLQFDFLAATARDDRTP